jgi:ATP-dependent protease HslVU (ClpYQ) peptidase subunit
MLDGVFTVAASQALELQLYPTASNSGISALNISGEVEIYTNIVFEKIG